MIFFVIFFAAFIVAINVIAGTITPSFLDKLIDIIAILRADDPLETQLHTLI